MSKYTNDTIRQDFVSYKNAILACKISHVASSEPVLIVSKDGKVTGVRSPEWIFVIASSINYNSYYFSDTADKYGQGLILENGLVHATSGALLEEDIILKIDLSEAYPEGYVFQRGTSVQTLLNAIFSSTRLGRGDGIQIYTQPMLDEMDDIPEQYIQIPSPEDIQGQDSTGKTYLEVLFSALRSLQAEVAKMRNAFKYGMQSYTGMDTTMSEVVNDISKTEEEPLWAVDEHDLSLTSHYMSFDEHIIPFEPQRNVDTSTPGVAIIKDSVKWTDTSSELESISDPKIFVYTTSTDLNAVYTVSTEAGATLKIRLQDL